MALAGGAIAPGGGTGAGAKMTGGATTPGRLPTGAVGTMSGALREVLSDGGGGMPAGV